MAQEGDVGHQNLRHNQLGPAGVLCRNGDHAHDAKKKPHKVSKPFLLLHLKEN
jgi:hypothetical protein